MVFKTLIESQTFLFFLVENVFFWIVFAVPTSKISRAMESGHWRVLQVPCSDKAEM